MKGLIARSLVAALAWGAAAGPALGAVMEAGAASAAAGLTVAPIAAPLGGAATAGLGAIGAGVLPSVLPAPAISPTLSSVVSTLSPLPRPGVRLAPAAVESPAPLQVLPAAVSGALKPAAGPGTAVPGAYAPALALPAAVSPRDAGAATPAEARRRRGTAAAAGELDALAADGSAAQERLAAGGDPGAELERFARGFDGAGRAAPGIESPTPAGTGPAGLRASGLGRAGVVDRLLASKETVVVAHGKNEYTGVAGEGTWANIAHSVEAARGRPVVLEVDIRRAGGGFIIFHDPTFHVLVRGYETPRERIEEFRRESPELARQKEGHWDYLLLDGVDKQKAEDLGKIRIFDGPSGREFPLIRLGGLIKSVEEPGKVRIPEHSYEARGPPAESGRVPARDIKAGPVALYLDFKEINHLARRLYGLPDWHWIIGSWGTERIEAFTRKALEDLSAALRRDKGHDKAFIAVRHPRVAAMAREIDPGIRLMASPDNVGPETTAEEWVRAMEPFLAHHPDLVEIKFLRHMRDPKIRSWAREHGLKILYDEIPQTDPSQFEGPYRGDLKRLVGDIVEHGSDVMIQTNTPEAVQSLVGRGDR